MKAAVRWVGAAATMTAWVLAVSGPATVGEGLEPGSFLLTVEVNSAADAVDASPGDAICATAAGECTLRAAVQEANALPGPQTVDVPPGTYNLARRGCCEHAADRGDIDITGDVTIAGSGPTQTIIRPLGAGPGSWDDRLLEVREGATVAVSDLTLSGVFMNSILPFDEDCGGGIRNFGNLTMTRMVIRDNVFRRSGGGVCNRGGTLRVTDSLIEGNHAALVGSGGGIVNSGYALLRRVTVSNNHSDTGGGGGIYNWGIMAVTDSTISGNTASADPDRGGGGVENSHVLNGFPDAALTVINSTISGNFTDGAGGGGGLSNTGLATATIINSTITGNDSGFFYDDFPEWGERSHLSWRAGGCP